MKNTWNLFQQTPHPSNVSDYFHTLNLSNTLNSVYWWDLFNQVRGLEGDIVECGVGRGRSLIIIASINRLISTLDKRPEREIFALDSFEGFPEPSEFDKSTRSPKKGEWSMSPNGEFKYSPDAISKVLKKADLDVDINFVTGFFDESTATLKVNKIALLHLDGDLYDSINAPLQNLWQKVVIGGLIIVDDFLFEKNGEDRFPGARIAVTEFLEQNDSFDYFESIRGTPLLKRKK